MGSSLLASESLTLKHQSPLHCISRPKPYPLSNLPLKKLRISATQSPLRGSTRTLRTLGVFSLAAAKALSHHIIKLGFELNASIAPSAGAAFFAAAKTQAPVGLLNTPLTLVAAGLAKWLDIYSGVLMVRVLLSWFPNIPWERQPLSAIRDLCDPYLNLFRNIIPPIFDTLDVSPLLAFAVLGTLGSILNSSRASY